MWLAHRNCNLKFPFRNYYFSNKIWFLGGRNNKFRFGVWTDCKPKKYVMEVIFGGKQSPSKIKVVLMGKVSHLKLEAIEVSSRFNSVFSYVFLVGIRLLFDIQSNILRSTYWQAMLLISTITVLKAFVLFFSPRVPLLVVVSALTVFQIHCWKKILKTCKETWSQLMRLCCST